jgi:hypothetical protein
VLAQSVKEGGMKRGEMERILGALLGGAASGGLRPRTRRRTPAPLIDIRVGGSRTAARALATLAGAVLGTVLGGAQGQPPAPPSRRSEPADIGSTRPTPASPPGRQGTPLPNPWSSPATPRPEPQGSAPQSVTDAEDAEALLILRGMISCAKADGTLDPAERAAIADQLDRAGLDQAARDLVLAEFARPAAVAEIAKEVREPVLAAQIYAAAFLAAGEVGPAERAWLDGFARASGLDEKAAKEIERRLSGE